MSVVMRHGVIKPAVQEGICLKQEVWFKAQLFNQHFLYHVPTLATVGAPNNAVCGCFSQGFLC